MELRHQVFPLPTPRLAATSSIIFTDQELLKTASIILFLMKKFYRANVKFFVSRVLLTILLSSQKAESVVDIFVILAVIGLK